MHKTALTTFSAAAAWAAVPVCVVAIQAPADLQAGSTPPSDSLEARVWLDRGEEPVVHPGDEVRVYYRTTADAFAAIFRIDTDGRISLLFPQHPDVDSYVGGGRDYRLLFPDSPRWQVREDPGMGYFFMVASPVQLDFSAFGFDADRGWDLSGVAETVYEDPYVAIDDYVSVILPEWEAMPYALDFLSYSVGEEQQYPRFLCYDCHGFRSYSSWNPYADLCSSYRIVIWNDPYFVPRYRYVGTRVVFARPFGPRPRYALTERGAGAGRGPVVRTRPPPPRRITGYEERARATPLRRPSAVVPDRTRGSARAAPAPRAPNRAAPTGGPRSGALPSRVAPSRGGPDRGTADRAVPRRATPEHGGPVRAGADRAVGARVERNRPTLLRRGPFGRLSRPPGEGRARVAPSRERPVVRTPPRGASPARPRPEASSFRPGRPPAAWSRTPPARSPGAATRAPGAPGRVTPGAPRAAPTRVRVPARARPERPPARPRPRPSGTPGSA